MSAPRPILSPADPDLNSGLKLARAHGQLGKDNAGCEKLNKRDIKLMAAAFVSYFPMGLTIPWLVAPRPWPSDQPIF